MLVPPPPNPEDFRVGRKLIAGLSHATVLADFDFETRSPAGHIWNHALQTFTPPRGSNKKGLQVVGASAYTEHPGCEVICLAYDLKDAFGARQWVPGQELPLDLFIHLQLGGLLEAWNVSFEYYVWNNVCVKRYGYPALNISSLRCAAAKSRAYSLPGALGECGRVLGIKNGKMGEGKRLIKRYCEPHKPTKSNKDVWHHIEKHPEDYKLMLQYNLADIKAEAEISNQVPDLSPQELEFWLVDQAINRRGVRMDREMIEACIVIVQQALAKYNAELPTLTGGIITSASQVARITTWLKEYGVFTKSLDKEHTDELLKLNLAPEVRRVLEIRQLIGSAAVKKLYAMINRLSADGRMRDLFVYHTARTGRSGGEGVQPQNLPNNNKLSVIRCGNCDRYSGSDKKDCTWCGDNTVLQVQEWNPIAAEDSLSVITTGSLSSVEFFFGEAVATVSGCLRGMFIAADNHDLISSDYASIEGVCLAMLAGEEWAIDVYKTHGCMYEMTASKITGTPFQEYIKYKKNNDKHHPDRKLGKVASLASGYQGALGAWLKFKADEFLTENQIIFAVKAWRKANPMIVKMWYELETAAHMATMNKGTEFGYREIVYKRVGDILYCRLPSGRYITYHRPQISPNPKRPGSMQLSFEGWNSDGTKGLIGWIRMTTYGGKLAENCTQAVARDILTHAIVNLERRSYPVVLHVHDEIVCEVPEDFGSVAELESIMMELPQWAEGWPIKAVGGWRAKRYQK